MMNNEDPYFHLMDFSPYLQVQDQIEAEYRDSANWTKKTILNVARSGKFSSDRAIGDYNRLVWHTKAPNGPL
jgi:starch phosphorylase